MSKPALTYREQLDLLKRRGLLVQDEAFAFHILEHHNYYRLSAYRFPFTVPGSPDQFRPGVTFAQLWELYQFDRALRQLVLEAGKRVEISARSRWAYELGHRLGATAYSDARHFRNSDTHQNTLAKLGEEMRRSNEEFIRHHRHTLGMAWPPAWVIVEICSFGVASRLIAELRDASLRQSIADSYQLDEKVFCSLLHHLCVLRNTAAHHSRLWNRRFTFTVRLPKKKPRHLHPNFHLPPQTGNQRRIYNSLVLLLHLIQCIEPASHWPGRLIRHLRTLDPTLIPEMGFPTDWQTRPIWKTLLATNP